MLARVLFFSLLLYHARAFKWQQTNPKIAMRDIDSMADNGQGTILILEQMYETPAIYFSYDNAVTWEPAVLYNESLAVDALEYGGNCIFFRGKFIIPTARPGVLFSDDAKSFYIEESNNHDFGIPDKFVNSSGEYLIVIDMWNGFLLLSADGIHYENHSFPVKTYVWDTALSYTGNMIIGCADGTCHGSTDGINWYSWVFNQILGAGYSLLGFDSGKGSEVLARLQPDMFGQFPPDLYSSLDFGKTWKRLDADYTWNPYNMFYGAGHYYGIFYKVGFLSIIYDFQISPDGLNWTTPNGTVPFEPFDYPKFFSLNNQEEVFVIPDTGYVSTTDFEHWIIPDIGVAMEWGTVFELSDGTFALEAYTNMTTDWTDVQYYTTPDGKTFTPHKIPPFSSDGFYYSTYLNNTFVVGSDGLWSSVDLETWTHHKYASLPNGSFVLDMLYDNGTWIAIGAFTHDTVVMQYFIIYTAPSLNGPWTKTYTSPKIQMFIQQHVAAAGNGVIILNLDGLIYASSDGGTTFGVGDFPKRNITTVIYEGSYFILHATENNVTAFSKDGISWTKVWMPIESRPVVRYSVGGDLYFAYDETGEIATSPDMMTWTLNETLSLNIPPSWEEYVIALAYNGATWLTVCYDSAVFAGQ